jgi:gamma-glutamyltranspeptidase/glutathione hydrolase
MKLLLLLIVLSIAAAGSTTVAQSPHAFGIPGPQAPTPTSSIKAVPGSRAEGWLDQGRSEVLARHGIVSTSDPLAAQAGLEILRQGGNAIDAAVAAGAVLDVTSQNDTGIGGDLFALVWVAKEKKLYALNSGGWAPAAWTPEFFTQKLRVRSVPSSGVNSATVPGAISGYDALLKRFGTLTFKETFERAAQMADEGWGLAERRASDLRGVVNALRSDADSRAVFLKGDQAPDLYSVIRNPGLATALRLIQKDGRDAFYNGPIAEAIVAKVRSNDGVMTKEDLAEFQSEWVEPISTNYHGYDIFELPPPGQGFAALEMLNILEVCVPKLGFNLATLGPSDPMFWHLEVEAKKLAYADLLAKNADPKFATVPVQNLLSKTYAATLCGKMNPNKASVPGAPGGPDGGTIYLTAADR